MSELVFCLMGPTAAGKTAVALELIKHFPCEIVSVDSAMIYQGMDIGTAKPDPETLARVPHHFIDCCPPNATYSAAIFCAEAQSIILDIQRRQRLPLLVGGTMMYFRALQQGLSVLPSADPAVRIQLSEQIQQQGGHALHAQLQRVDAVSAARIHPNDTQRLQRALEVYLLTGKPWSEQLVASTPLFSPHFINMALFPEQRAWLHQRIHDRLQDMLAQGFLTEVKALVQQWQLNAGHPAMRSVGYRQALAYLNGEIDYPTFCAKVLVATRQLAKRQLTWLRSWPEMRYFDPETPQCVAKIVAYMKQIMHNSKTN